MMAKIEKISLNDIATLAEIHKNTLNPAWSAVSFADMLNDPTVVGWKLQDAQIIKCFIFVRFIVDEAEILTLSVNPPYQRQGLGDLLINYLDKHCQQHLIKKKFLEVNENNIAAIQLYEKHNFTIIGIRKNYYKIGPHLHQNALIMTKAFN